MNLLKQPGISRYCHCQISSPRLYNFAADFTYVGLQEY